MDWQIEIQRAVMDLKEVPLGYGLADCCQFLARYWQRMTGDDYSAAWDYRSETQALRLIASNGGSLIALISRCIGPPHPFGFFAPGDAVVVQVGREQAAGVYNLGTVLVLHPEKGWCRAKPANIVASWSCPHK